VTTCTSQQLFTKEPRKKGVFHERDEHRHLTILRTPHPPPPDLPTQPAWRAPKRIASTQMGFFSTLLVSWKVDPLVILG
jgi:hypothetical protein